MKHYRTDFYLIVLLLIILLSASFLFRKEKNDFFSTEKIELQQAKKIDKNKMAYATITKETPLYDEKTGRKVNNTNTKIDQTLRIKKAIKIETSRYFLLADKKEKILGYVSEDGVALKNSPAGVFHQEEKYIVTPNKKFHWFNDFEGNSKLSNKLEEGKTYQSRGYYQHYDGQKYLSIFSNKGEWLGFIKENVTKPAEKVSKKMKKVQEYLDKENFSKDFGIYVLSLADGSVAQKNGNEPFRAASTGKLPILYYTQKMIDDKKIDPKKEYEYVDAINKMKIFSYQPDGAGVLQNHEFGEKFSIETILKWTIHYSDNQGANFLGYYAGDKYDEPMRNEISRIIGRKWDDRDPMTPKENALLMEAIYEQNGEIIDELSDTDFDDQRIPKYIPVQVAHKIGDVYDLKHDVAIVYTNQPFILSVMTKGDRDYEEISVLAREIYKMLE